jgi:hypothetical protein
MFVDKAPGVSRTGLYGYISLKPFPAPRRQPVEGLALDGPEQPGTRHPISES